MFARRLIAGGSWAFLGKIFALLLGVGTNALLARLLEPAELGIYFLVMSLATTAAFLGQLGQNQVVVRLIADKSATQRHARIPLVIGNALLIVGFGSLGIALFYVLFSYYATESLFHTPLIAAMTIPVACLIVGTALRSLAAECFRGFHDIYHATLFEAVAFAGIFFAVVMAIWMAGKRVDFAEIIVWSLIATVVSAVLAWWKLLRRVEGLSRVETASIPRMLRIGWPLMVSNLVVMLTTQAGLWIVGMMASPSEVALYGAAFRLVILLQMPLLVLNSVIPPLIADLYAKKNFAQMEQLLRFVTAVALLPALLVLALFLFWGHELLGWLYGGYYAGSYWILIYLAAGIMVNAWVGFCGPALMMTGGQRPLMVISVLSAVVSIGLAFPFGAMYGGEGVAVAMSAGVALQHLLMLVMVKRRLGIWTHAGNLTRQAWSTLRNAG